METLEKIGENPLLVSIITLILTTIIWGIGFLIKRVITGKVEKRVDKYSNQQSNIIQNFNTGISYNDVRKIAEEVVEVAIEDKLSKLENKEENSTF